MSNITCVGKGLKVWGQEFGSMVNVRLNYHITIYIPHRCEQIADPLLTSPHAPGLFKQE